MKEIEICFPHQPASGGPGTFQKKIEDYIKNIGWKVSYKNNFSDPSIIFVIGGTKNILWLHRMKRKGIPILYRLDGINWLHRKTKFNFKKYFLCETRNLINKYSHAFIADKIIYQSNFVKQWWEKEGFKSNADYEIIYNGSLIHTKLSDKVMFNNKLIILEGTIDYSPYAIELINQLSDVLDNLEIHLYGNFENKRNIEKLNDSIVYHGFISNSRVKSVFNNSIYLSLDINPACPNAVIEALCCGTPVVGYDTGSLKELVGDSAGIIIPYGSDPWELKFPDVIGLANAIKSVARNYDEYSKNAHSLALKAFDIKLMNSYYLQVIKKLISDKNHGDI